MSQLFSLLLSALMVWPGVGPQARAEAPADTAFHAVSYVEVASSSASRTAAIAAMKEYMAASRKESGFLRYELFEQSERPGHFVAIETWREQKAFDARSPALQKQLTAALQPIRTSDLDQRPYKTLTAAPSNAPTNSQTVFVISHVDVSPSPQVAALVQRLAEDSRKDEGNIRFDVLLHTMRSNHFTVIEAWRNRKALDAHAASPHTKQYRDELGPFLGSPLDERVFVSVAW
jgi:quinol monooxygenase YgiN